MKMAPWLQQMPTTLKIVFFTSCTIVGCTVNSFRFPSRTNLFFPFPSRYRQIIYRPLPFAPKILPFPPRFPDVNLYVI